MLNYHWCQALMPSLGLQHKPRLLLAQIFMKVPELKIYDCIIIKLILIIIHTQIGLLFK